MEKEDVVEFFNGLKEAADEHPEMADQLGLGVNHGPQLKVPGRSEIEISNKLIFEIMEVLMEHDRDKAVSFMTVLIADEEPFGNIFGSRSPARIRASTPDEIHKQSPKPEEQEVGEDE